MLRLTGILTGSAIAIAVLFFTIGIPKISAPPQPIAAAPEDQAAAQDEIIVAADLPETEPHEDALAPVPQLEDEAEPAMALEPDTPTAPVPLNVAVEFEADAHSAPLATGQQAEEVASKWFAFWSPFHSEIAADGFVSALQRTTGLDYRVVKLKPGVYEVAFAYSDDTDREDKLSRISAATGLDVSG